jgi:hypothetical protein
MVVYSRQGAGKGIIYDFFKSIIGDQYVTTVGDNDSLTGRFNSHRANKLLVMANELGSGGAAYQEANFLKSIITDKEDYIECKGVDRRPINSVSSLLMFTNEWKAVRLEKDDRRYFVQECNDKFANKPDYFGPLVQLTKEPEAQVLMFRFLRARDIKKRHFPSTIPDTPYRRQLQDEQTPLSHMFLRDMVNGAWCNETNWIMPSASILAQMTEWAKTMHEHRRDQFMTSTQFGREMRQLGVGSAKPMRLPSGEVARCYNLESREDLAARLGIKVQQV